MQGIEVKGDQDGLILLLPAAGSNDDIVASLHGYLASKGAFFKGADIVLDVGGRRLTAEELDRLRETSQRWQVTIVSLRASDEVTRRAARELDIETPFQAKPQSNAARSNRPITVPDESTDALLVRRTLRSGQVVRHPQSVLVVGDVNAGAEIVAGGDVVVWGSLRGVVHAGAMGNVTAVVCALNLVPTQLRISDQIAVSPDERKKKGGRFQPWKRLAARVPERARLQNGHIIVEPWPEK